MFLYLRIVENTICIGKSITLLHGMPGYIDQQTKFLA
ncbi:hypothetical protein ES705_20757 [subsurface metagenome]